MDIIKSAARALWRISDRGIKVRQGWYDQNFKELHVTLWLLNDADTGYSDDETEIESQMIQINIWSDSDQVALKREIKKLMKEAGFAFIDAHDEMETETRVFINAMRFTLIKESEEI